MLDDAFQASTDAALTDLAMRPQAPQTRKPSLSVWGLGKAAGGGIGAGLAQGFASSADILGAFGDVLGGAEASAGGMFAVQSDAERKQADKAREKLRTDGVSFRQEGAIPFRNVAKDYMADPVTAHGAEVAVSELFRMGTKAIGAAVTLGPVGGAVVAGAEEGFSASEALAEQGVDLATRTKVGAVTGAITAAGFALPVAGKTVAGTVGLALAGGPVSFTAQQAATRAILDSADYSKLAEQYDPFDPVGLTLSTLLPLGFGALAMRGAKVKAKAGEADVHAPADTPAPGTIADQATVDAARVNLLREVSDAHRMTPADDLAGAAAHEQAVTRAIDQMAGGQRVEVEDLLSEPARVRATEEIAARLKPLEEALTEFRAKMIATEPAGPVSAIETVARVADAARSPETLPMTGEPRAAQVTSAGEGGSKALKLPVEDAALDARAVQLEQAMPDLEIKLDGMDSPVKLGEFMKQLREEVGQDLAEAPLIEAAANCFLRG